MTARELAARLADLHRREKSIAALLFGIEYARDIEECRNLMGLSRNAVIIEIVQLSGIPPSYTINVDKGIRMAPYVSVQRRPCRNSN